MKTCAPASLEILVEIGGGVLRKFLRVGAILTIELPEAMSFGWDVISVLGSARDLPICSGICHNSTKACTRKGSN